LPASGWISLSDIEADEQCAKFLQAGIQPAAAHRVFHYFQVCKSL
jgi:hypothetical protein